LYGGHYWGPAPALPHLVWRLLTGRSLPESVVEVSTGVVGAIAFWLLLAFVRRRYVPDVPRWLLVACLVAFAARGMYPYLLARPIIYNAPLLVAGAALMVSWYLLLCGLDEFHQKQRAYFFGSGTLLGLAIASRITYVGYAVDLAQSC
jgi:hypothetical protein